MMQLHSQLDTIYQMHINQYAYTRAIQVLSKSLTHLIYEREHGFPEYRKSIDTSQITEPSKPDIPVAPKLELRQLHPVPTKPPKVRKPSVVGAILWFILKPVICFLGIIILPVLLVLAQTTISALISGESLIENIKLALEWIPAVIGLLIMVALLLLPFYFIPLFEFILETFSIQSAENDYNSAKANYNNYQEYLAIIKENDVISAENTQREIEYHKQLKVFNDNQEKYRKMEKDYEQKYAEYKYSVVNYTTEKIIEHQKQAENEELFYNNTIRQWRENLESLNKSLSDAYKNIDVLFDHHDPVPFTMLYQYFNSGRCDTMKKAISIYNAEKQTYYINKYDDLERYLKTMQSKRDNDRYCIELYQKEIIKLYQLGIQKANTLLQTFQITIS
ncbi:MAG: hypothetical protein IJW77_02210 [Clostridia bacterium]|nr:hypothetical protein [Clostridia bacterium]